MQQRLHFQGDKHGIACIIGVGHTNICIDIGSASRYVPPLWDHHAEIRRLVFFKLSRFGRCLCYLNTLFRILLRLTALLRKAAVLRADSVRLTVLLAAVRHTAVIGTAVSRIDFGAAACREREQQNHRHQTCCQ